MTAIGHDIETYAIEWTGIRIEVLYERKWFGLDYTAHLQIESITPRRAPLPMTETGYRSHFISAEQIEEAGGPVAYTLTWLEYAANETAWREYVEQQRQLTLF